MVSVSPNPKSCSLFRLHKERLEPSQELREGAQHFEAGIMSEIQWADDEDLTFEEEEVQVGEEMN